MPPHPAASPRCDSEPHHDDHDIKGLNAEHIWTLIQVAHKNLKDRVGTSQARMAETRARIKIRDRFVGERISVARARIPAVTVVLAAHEAEAGRRIKRYGQLAPFKSRLELSEYSRAASVCHYFGRRL